MKRWSGILFRSLCLLIFVLSIVMWVRSYFVGESLYRVRQYIDSARPPFIEQSVVDDLVCARGTLGIVRGRSQFRTFVGLEQRWSYQRWRPNHPVILGDPHFSGPDWRFGPFQWVHQSSEQRDARNAITGAVIPLWLFLPFGLPPLRWLLRRRRERARGFAVLPRGGGEAVPPDIDTRRAESTT